MTSTVEKNIALLNTAYAALQGADLDACQEFLTEDFIANLPGAPEPLHGREIWRMGAQSMLDGFPDLEVDVRDVFGADDKVTALVVLSGTHRGEFQGVAPTGRRVAFHSVEVYRMEGDRIAEEWVAPDMVTLMRQLTEER